MIINYIKSSFESTAFSFRPFKINTTKKHDHFLSTHLSTYHR